MTYFLLLSIEVDVSDYLLTHTSFKKLQVRKHRKKYSGNRGRKFRCSDNVRPYSLIKLILYLEGTHNSYPYPY